MKKKLFLILLFSCSAFAESNLIEFNLVQSPVIYQLNKSSGSLFGVIRDVSGGVCLHKMDFKNRSHEGNVFVYERNDTERLKTYYQKFEVNLISSQVNIFTSMRNRNSIIPIEIRECSSHTCLNLSNVPMCSYQ